jgi:hypothetical protein
MHFSPLPMLKYRKSKLVEHEYGEPEINERMRIRFQVLPVFLYVYYLLNNTLSSSDCRESNGMMINE